MGDGGLLKVRLTGRAHTAYVAGRGAYKLLWDLTGRRPQWARREHAYVVQERTARDALAAAEARGWRVLVSQPTPPAPAAQEPVPEPEGAADQEVLW